LAALLLIALPLPGFTAQGADAGSASQTARVAPAARPPLAAKSELPKVTIEATKERQALRHQVDQFVAAVVVRPWDESLIRWNVPICPLVAGLPREFGEFMLKRISQAAIDAHAQLAGKVCRPNLYVVATDSPDLLLKKWWKRDRHMYDTARGIPPIERFVRSRRPIRVWYNAGFGCGGAARARPRVSAGAPAGFGPSGFGPPLCTGGDGIDTHLSYGDIRSISSAIVVIDLRRMKNVAIQQMADYVALVTLADVRLDTDPTSAPSILWLFSQATPPPGLSPWDQALLYSLYNTTQTDKLQVSEMESTMAMRMAP
jgi:hypothetical protein